MRTTGYREHFGWTVNEEENAPRLVLGHNMVALAMARTTGGVVLDYLCRHDTRGPVLELDPGTWVFLADSNGLVLNAADLPDGVRLLGCGTAIPVPLTARHLPVRWVVAPNVRQRWLPSLAALVAAAQTTAGSR
ncbi:MAG TPA: hypothetical protein VJ870_15285 [Amycolatopsis sp.]|nr:hypothetical protein [Amycolatopsis sp.]